MRLERSKLPFPTPIPKRIKIFILPLLWRGRNCLFRQFRVRKPGKKNQTLSTCFSKVHHKKMLIKKHKPLPINYLKKYNAFFHCGKVVYKWRKKYNYTKNNVYIYIVRVLKIVRVFTCKITAQKKSKCLAAYFLSFFLCFFL